MFIHRIDKISQANTEKVLASFSRHRVSDGCFAGTTGYGYDDVGRDKLEQIYADVFGGESALEDAHLRDVAGDAVRFHVLRQQAGRSGAHVEQRLIIGEKGDLPGASESADAGNLSGDP